MQPPTQRPRSVTVFGILNIVFAAFGLLGLLATIAMLTSVGATNNPVVNVMRDSPGYLAWMKISIPVGLLASAVLLTAGIGLLQLKPWARVLSLVYGIWAIATGLVSLAFNYVYLVQPMMQEAARKQGPDAAATLGGAIGGLFGGCLGLVYPILLLIFMTRRNVVEAFRPSGSLPPSLP